MVNIFVGRCVYEAVIARAISSVQMDNGLTHYPLYDWKCFYGFEYLLKSGSVLSKLARMCSKLSTPLPLFLDSSLRKRWWMTSMRTSWFFFSLIFTKLVYTERKAPVMLCLTRDHHEPGNAQRGNSPWKLTSLFFLTSCDRTRLIRHIVSKQLSA